MNDFRTAIRRALNQPCTTDILGAFGSRTSTGDRNVWDRMSRLREAAIANNGLPSSSILARQFNVSTKTIWRDLKFLRDRGFPLSYEDENHCYVLTKEAAR
jgi:biotin operon repressor